VLTEGGYRDALRFHPGHLVEFDTETFIRSSPATMRPFLLTVLHLQAFEQFIADRLDMLNSGHGFKGLFESEVNIYVDRMDSQKRYREWIKVFTFSLFIPSIFLSFSLVICSFFVL